MTNRPLLSVDGVTVDFDGFKALNSFSFILNSGETRVVIGPNGAGKSTLCDTIIGRVRPAEGHIYFEDVEITKMAEQDIVRQGICRKFQAPGVLPELTVSQNLELAAQRQYQWWKSLRQGVSAETRTIVEDMLERIELTHRKNEPAGLLSHGEKQWLEIGMVISTGAKLLLLDEPTAGMGPAETRRTAELIKSLGDSQTVLVIDHDMSFVEQLNASVTVMHQGKFLFQGDIEAVRQDENVAAVYLGKSA
ncbi:urea ABC transporter ATP-binding protein UrtD [Hirschia litorea]|uniref:Urea ABC transporter ATP-binding protein UrtD n=1 Tax=Hirschia litorea TaxID=1199156 RepID=A0ABW2IPR0_9PROT